MDEITIFLNRKISTSTSIIILFLVTILVIGIVGYQSYLTLKFMISITKFPETEWPEKAVDQTAK